MVERLRFCGRSLVVAVGVWRCLLTNEGAPMIVCCVLHTNSRHVRTTDYHFTYMELYGKNLKLQSDEKNSTRNAHRSNCRLLER